MFFNKFIINYFFKNSSSKLNGILDGDPKLTSIPDFNSSVRHTTAKGVFFSF